MNDHIPDPTKMINDTPRTDEAQFGTGRVSVNFACQLERELNAANDRIKRLEEAGDVMAQELVRRELRKEIDERTAAKEAKP